MSSKRDGDINLTPTPVSTAPEPEGAPKPETPLAGVIADLMRQLRASEAAVVSAHSKHLADAERIWGLEKEYERVTKELDIAEAAVETLEKAARAVLTGNGGPIASLELRQRDPSWAEEGHQADYVMVGMADFLALQSASSPTPPTSPPTEEPRLGGTCKEWKPVHYREDGCIDWAPVPSPEPPREAE